MRRILAVLLALALPLVAGDAGWERVKTLRAGERIWIKYQDGKKNRSTKAVMEHWTEEDIAVRLNDGQRLLARDDVLRVSVYGGKSRARGAGIGALAGATIGAGLYGAIIASDPDGLDVPPGALIGGGALFIAGIGAAIGLAVGATRKLTIYEAGTSGTRGRSAVR